MKNPFKFINHPSVFQHFFGFSHFWACFDGSQLDSDDPPKSMLSTNTANSYRLTATVRPTLRPASVAEGSNPTCCERPWSSRIPLALKPPKFEGSWAIVRMIAKSGAKSLLVRCHPLLRERTKVYVKRVQICTFNHVPWNLSNLILHEVPPFGYPMVVYGLCWFIKK